VARYEVRSQEELVALLAREGVEATQATVSRDLEELGVAKQRGADGQLSYAPPAPAGLAQTLRAFATGVEASGNLAVVHTPPGLAGAVASAVDHGDVAEVLATVQGDDTVLVVAAEPATGADVADRLLACKHARPQGLDGAVPATEER
jgi:transcriptional regulator of arginine metabolism